MPNESSKVTKSSRPRSARADLVDPVAGREQLGRAGRRVAPRRRVEAGAVEADGEVHVAWQRRVRHAGSSVRAPGRHRRAGAGRSGYDAISTGQVDFNVGWLGANPRARRRGRRPDGGVAASSASSPTPSCSPARALRDPPDRPAPRAGSGGCGGPTSDPLLWMNSMAEDVTMFTDDSVRCAGPIRPGPSLAEWALHRRRRDAGRLAPPDVAAEIRGLDGHDVPDPARAVGVPRVVPRARARRAAAGRRDRRPRRHAPSTCVDEPDGRQRVVARRRRRRPRRRQRRAGARPPRHRPARRRRAASPRRRRARPRPHARRAHRRAGPVRAAAGRRRHRPRLRPGVHRPPRARHRGPRRALRRRRPATARCATSRAATSRSSTSGRGAACRTGPSSTTGCRRRWRRSPASSTAPTVDACWPGRADRVPARPVPARRQGGRLGVLPRAVPRPRRAHDVRRGTTSRRATRRPPFGAELDAVVADCVPPPTTASTSRASTGRSPGAASLGATSSTTGSPRHVAADVARRTDPTYSADLGAFMGLLLTFGVARPHRRVGPHGAALAGATTSAAGGSASSCTTPAARRPPGCASCWRSPTPAWCASSAPARRCSSTTSSGASSPAARATTTSSSPTATSTPASPRSPSAARRTASPVPCTAAATSSRRS